jgi:hypothetical protein
MNFTLMLDVNFETSKKAEGLGDYLSLPFKLSCWKHRNVAE